MKTRLRRILHTSCILLTGVIPAAAHAQTGLVTTQGRATVGIGYETYRFGTPESADLKSLSLISAPFAAGAPLFGRVSIDVRGAYARGRLVDADGNEATLSGLVDTEVGLNVGIGSGPTTATISLMGVLPTGTEQLDGTEARIAGLIASELLPFRFTNWGMGGAIGASAQASRAIGSGSVGIGVGYLASREFKPLRTESAAGEFTYQPGNRVQLRAAADRNIGASKLSLSIAYEYHEDDKLQGVNLYRSGDRFQGVASYAFAAGTRGAGIIYAGGLHSAEGAPTQAGLNLDFSARTLLLAGGGVRLPVGAAVLVPSLDLRLFRRGSGSGQGYLSGVGASLEYAAGAATILPSARVRFGNLVVEDGVESEITGVDVGLSLRFSR